MPKSNVRARPKALSARKITCGLLDWLLAQKGFELIAVEVPVLSQTKRADLVTFKNGKTICYEVKSGLDSLRRLETQIAVFSSLFNEVYVVSDPNHLSGIQKVLPKKIGIIVLTSNGFKVLRKATERKKFDKRIKIEMLWRNEIIRVLKFKKKISPQEETLSVLQEALLRSFRGQQIDEIVYESLKARYLRSFSLFSFDRGLKTTIHDLENLSGLK